MKYVKMILKPKESSVADISDEAIDKLEYLLSSLYKNGQIQDYWDVVVAGDNLLVFMTQVDVDSLDEKYDGEYVKNNKKEIEPYFDISIEAIGTSFYADETCACQSPEFYILYTANWHMGSPIICGSCGHSIPVYKLPLLDSKSKIGGKDYSTVLNWENTWKEIEGIWYASLADRWAERQIINPKSALSKWGREWICKDFEKVTDKKFYYFLFDADYNDKFDLQKKCPECGKEWQKHKIQDEEWSLCDDCRLTTNKHWKD